MNKTIKFTISKTGEVQMEVNGVSGPACQDLTKPFIEALGGEVLDVEEKPEYFVNLEGMEQYVSEE